MVTPKAYLVATLMGYTRCPITIMVVPHEQSHVGTTDHLVYGEWGSPFLTPLQMTLQEFSPPPDQTVRATAKEGRPGAANMAAPCPEAVLSKQSIDGEGSNQEAGIPSTNKNSYPTYAQKRYALKRKLSVGGSNELLGFLKSSQKNEKQEQALIDVLKQEFLDATQDTKDYAVMCSSEKTLNLLTIYQQPEMRSKFSKNKKSRMIAWRAVSRIMTELGFPRTPQQCMYRFSNLRKKYNNIKKALQAGEPKPKWPYWEEFEAIYEPRERGVAVYLDDAMLQPEDDMSASSPQASTLTPTHELGGDGDKINQAQGLTLGCDVKNVHQPTTAFPQTNNQSTNKRTLEETIQGQSGVQNQNRNFKASKRLYKCNYCKKLGHKAADCWTKMANEKQVSMASEQTHAAAEEIVTLTSSSVSTLCAKLTRRDDVWCVDSGATTHMCRDKNSFLELTPTISQKGSLPRRAQRKEPSPQDSVTSVNAAPGVASRSVGVSNVMTLDDV
uniref:Myb/SANT-like DNA-binding domain-containing protein n=1 Tax=Timema shepardi TaxID=629360 RepID=A0A7R9APR5_TIMSH|nr:unnamed protein product [Timema shepardi]